MIIGMVADDVFFAPASAELTPTALEVISTTGQVLAGISDQIQVEGNANTLPAGRNYETNWELAADRAVKVLRVLTESGAVPGNRIAPVSFGDQRPLADDGGDPLSANRRVDLVILTSVSDEIRKYLPEIAAREGEPDVDRDSRRVGEEEDRGQGWAIRRRDPEEAPAKKGKKKKIIVIGIVVAVLGRRCVLLPPRPQGACRRRRCDRARRAAAGTGGRGGHRLGEHQPLRWALPAPRPRPAADG